MLLSSSFLCSPFEAGPSVSAKPLNKLHIFYFLLSWCLASSWQHLVAIPLTIYPDVGKNLSGILHILSSRQQGSSATAAELLPNLAEFTLFAGIHNLHYYNSQYLSYYHL
jgi:hypothetical protein